MLTQCPYPECQQVFRILKERGVSHGLCVNCGRPMTYRELGVLQELERKRQRQVISGIATGGSTDGCIKPARLSALLEDVRSLYNVGSIFRTSDGAGFSHLYLCGITGCPPHRQIAKTSLGAEENVSWEYFTGSSQILPRLKRQGVMILALERIDNSQPLTELIALGAVKVPLCLAVGNEVSGISAETLACCDLICHLPMRGSKESLNVAVAFGIASYLLADVA